MGLGNGNPKSGNKGSNFNFEHRLLLAIGDLIASSGSGPALATESTLISVLNAIVAADQDIEILLVRDTGNADLVVQQITNYETGVPVVTYKDVDGNPYVPVGPLEYLDPSAVMNLMLTELLDQGLTLDAIETELLAQGLSLDALLIDTANLDVALSTRATEATQLLVDANLTLLNTKLNTLGQKASAASAPVVLSTEQEAILTAIDAVLDTIKLDTANITADPALNATVLATNVLLTQIDAVLDLVLVDTNAMVVDLAAIEVLLTTIDGVLDAIKLDTAAMVVDLAAIEVLLTTIDAVLDTIKLDTAAIAADTSTLATPVTALATNLSRFNGIGTVAAGKRRVSFFNAGAANATVAGGTLAPGEVVTFSADGLRDVLAAIPFVATGTDLLTTTVG